jgi:hypothetical protein
MSYFGGFFFATDTEYLALGSLNLGAAVNRQKITGYFNLYLIIYMKLFNWFFKV